MTHFIVLTVCRERRQGGGEIKGTEEGREGGREKEEGVEEREG